MPRAKWWNGSAWVDLRLSGAADLQGSRFQFSRPAGTVDEFFALPNPLSSNNWADAGSNVGTRFTVNGPGSWIGVRVWRPSFVQNVNAEYVFAANVTANTLLSPNTTLVNATRGAFVIQEFVTPISIVAGTTYMACYHTDRYGFSRYTDGAVLPLTSTLGKITTTSVASTVAFFTYSNNTVPSSSAANFHFNVSPVVRFPA